MRWIRELIAPAPRLPEAAWEAALARLPWASGLDAARRSRLRELVDAFLRRELGKLLPVAAWLSEETADDKIRTQSNLIWLVDPIDGTRDSSGTQVASELARPSNACR